MAQYIEIEDFLNKRNEIKLIDVRSPSEYLQGHISGAINIPVFSDEERAIVGTIYKKQGPDIAILKGLEFAGAKMAELAKQAKKIAQNKQLIIHCWRGGMRSSSMAWLFEIVGIKTFVLKGGYKSYRSFIRQSFEKEITLLILSGFTGCGKTDVLTNIMKLGEQVIDLENIAHHKGSAFGSYGQLEQPTNEQFENDLYEKWRNINSTKPLWLEDESQFIGKVEIPKALFHKIKSANVIKMDIPKQLRIKRLSQEYALFDADLLKRGVLAIQKRLGGLNTQIAIEEIENKNFDKAIDLVLTYYDKSYNYGLQNRLQSTIHTIDFEEDNPLENAKQLINFTKQLKI